MNVIDKNTGEVWERVRVRDLLKIRRLRKAGLDSDFATRLVLGSPTRPAEAIIEPDGWDFDVQEFTPREVGGRTVWEAPVGWMAHTDW